MNSRAATPPRARRTPASSSISVRASVSDDKLASIMSYLDAVENEGVVPAHHAAGVPAFKESSTTGGSFPIGFAPVSALRRIRSRPSPAP